MLEYLRFTRVRKIWYLQHGVAVCIGDVGLQASQISLVVVAEVKVLNPKLGVFDLHLAIALGHLHEWLIT